MLYILFCDQDLMLKKAAEKIIRKDYPIRDAFNYISFDLRNDSLNALLDECDFLPIGYEKKAVVGENAFFLGKNNKEKLPKGQNLDRLSAYVKSPNPGIDLFLLCQCKELNTKLDIVESIKLGGIINEVKIPSIEGWASIIEKKLASANCKIDHDAAIELAARLDCDYGRIQEESDKLLCFADNGTITLQDVINLVASKPEEEGWAIYECLLKGDKQGALSAYNDLKIKGIDEISMSNYIVKQFIYLDQLAYLNGQGYSLEDIANAMGESKTGRVYINLKKLRTIPPSLIKDVIEDLYTLQRKLLSGEEEKEFAFTRFLANFPI